MKISTNLARQRGISARSTWLLILALGLAGAGYFFFFPSAIPTAPRLIAPPDGIQTIAGAEVTLRWEQGGARTLDQRQPRSAQSFIICVFQPGAQDCDGSGSQAPLLREEHAASALNRQLVQRGGLAGAIQNALDARFAYTHAITLPAGAPAGAYQWRVAACGTMGGVDCGWTVPGRGLDIHDNNLVAVNIDDNTRYFDDQSRTEMVLDVDIENAGSKDLGPFQLQTVIYRIRSNPSNDPLTDLNDPAVTTGDTVITDDFVARSYNDAVASGLGVYAIIPPGSPPTVWTIQVSNVPAGATQRIKPCNATRCTIPQDAGATLGTTTLFMGIAWADSQQQIFETDEQDNFRRENKLQLTVLQ